MKLCLYSDRAPENLDLKKISGYLKKLGFRISVLGDFLEKHFSADKKQFAARLAAMRIKDFNRPGALNFKPSETDILEELEALESREPVKLNKDLSNVYDGFGLEKLFREIYGKREFAIIFTSRMFATWDKRYHGRTIVCGYPIALISTTGLVEAPAKPKEYYAKLAAYHRAKQMGLPVQEESDFLAHVKQELKGRFLDYGDPRLTEVANGYALQAAFFFATFEPFCELKNCRLYNAHSQEEMLAAQVRGRLCSRHEGLLRKFCNC